MHIAQIHEEMLNAPNDAIDTYNEILGQAPDDLKALRALDRLYVGRAAWRDLGDNITRQLALVDQPGQQVKLLVRLAQPARDSSRRGFRGRGRDLADQCSDQREPPTSKTRSSAPSS